MRIARGNAAPAGAAFFIWGFYTVVCSGCGGATIDSTSAGGASVARQHDAGGTAPGNDDPHASPTAAGDAQKADDEALPKAPVESPETVAAEADAVDVGRNSTTPATPAEAAAGLDISKLPLLPDREEVPRRCLARLTYITASSVAEAYDFHRQQLAELKWEELSGGYASAESTNGTFAREGYKASLSASSLGGEKPATMVSLINHGNVRLASLPKPAGSSVLYDMPVSMAYLSTDPVEAAARQIGEALIAAGWEPYGSAGDSRYYKQNGVKLIATASAAPAQGGKTVVTYQSEQLSVDIPAPVDAQTVQYSEPPTQLFVEMNGGVATADKWYREQLAKLGWEPTTEQPIKDGFTSFVTFRNKEKALLEINFREVEDFTRLQLKYSTAEEMAQEEQRLKKKLAGAEADEGR